MTKQTLLVTGGAGFLGYHICKKLHNKFNKVIVIDIDEFNPKEYAENVIYERIDIRDKEKTNDLISKEKPSFIIHAAAALPLCDRKTIFNVNVKGTENILESALNNCVKRVVHISSTAVYGVPEKHPLYEDDPLVGVGPYGETKIIAEKICRSYRKKGLCVPIIRPKTFIGTGRLGVFQILYDWVEKGKRIPLIGNGKNHYQLLEVEDLVDAIYLTLSKPITESNNTFNVGSVEFDTVNEDVGSLCSFAKSGARVMSTPASYVKFSLRVFEALNLSPLYKWVYGTADTDSFVSTEKIEKELGWKPKYSNSEALIRSYRWYLENKNELQPKATGVTHRIAWSQGILGVIKKVL